MFENAPQCSGRETKRSPGQPRASIDLLPDFDNRPLQTLLKKHSNLNIAGRVRQTSFQVGQGGYSDVFIGWLKLENGKECKVAVKKLRTHVMGDKKFQKTLAWELYIWSKLKHPRILPLEGFYIDESGYPYLVSKWMENGTVLQYLETNPSVNILWLVAAIAEGIHYLHEKKIVHSDIKPDNILMSDSGEPLLCDFGVSRMLADTATSPISSTLTSGLRGTIRYMARELLRGDDPKHTEASDVWAYGMTVYTLLTMRQPYDDMQSEVRALLAIIDGKLPSWPEDVGSWPIEMQILRSMCERCWEEPSIRPAIDIFVKELRDLRPAVARENSLLHVPTSGNNPRTMSAFQLKPLRIPVIPRALSSDPPLPQKKCSASGTVQHTSSNRLNCKFTVDGYRLIFDASSSPGLPQFPSKNAIIYFDDSDELTGTQTYQGFVGVNSYTLTLENGTAIIGELDFLRLESMKRISGSGIWIST